MSTSICDVVTVTRQAHFQQLQSKHSVAKDCRTNTEAISVGPLQNNMQVSHVRSEQRLSRNKFMTISPTWISTVSCKDMPREHVFFFPGRSQSAQRHRVQLPRTSNRPHLHIKCIATNLSPHNSKDTCTRNPLANAACVSALRGGP